MGLLVNGQWRTDWYDTKSTAGEFVRSQAGFRRAVTADGSSGFPAQSGRYHLYVAMACPWAHRALIFRKLKGLEDVISASVVHPFMGESGWSFVPGSEEFSDSLHGLRHLYEIYLKADPQYSGRVTVPVLWDRQTRGIVNNESSEIIRMLNTEFNAFTANGTDYYPPPLREAIDAVNDRVYHHLNNGVYKCGFATTQEAYERNFDALFALLDELEVRLGQHRYLVGDTLTEADWRLFPTLLRFDAVYYSHFKCNLRRIDEYPNLSNYLRDLYQVPGISSTFDLEQTKQHYYMSHESINPARIVPKGPLLDFNAPHDRGRFQRAPQR